MKHNFKAKGKLWRWKGDAGWHFFTIEKDLASDIKTLVDKSNGWGQIKVEVGIGNTTWQTSLFPTKEGGFVLPVKKDVRKAEKIVEGDVIEVRLSNYLP